MKALKLLIVLLLVGWQANATGFSHNMLVAQKMLNAKQNNLGAKSQKQSSALLLAPRPAVAEPATESADEETTLKAEDLAVSLSQRIARWVVRLVTLSGEILAEALIAIFSAGNESEGRGALRLY